MSTRRPSFLLNPFAWLPSGLVAVSLTLLTPLVGTVQAGMIGTGLAPRAVAVGDINEDGYADLVSGNNSDSTVSVSLGRGNGTFDPKVQYSCGSSVYGIALADLNVDGHLDVVSCCLSIGMVGVRFGAGDGTFGARTDYAVSNPLSVVVRDLNADGLPDLMIGGSTNLSILTATGAGTFGPPATTPANAPSFGVGDVDDDGDADIVAPYSAGNGVLVYHNLSPGVYSVPTLFPTQGPSSGVALTDLNHDGRLDIVATIGGSAAVNVLLGVAGVEFGAYTSFATGASPLAIASADLNGDTHPDLVVTCTGGNSVSVLLGDGSGAFLPKADYFAGVNPQSIAVGLLDGDANLDLATAAFGQNSICALPGNGNGTFQVPSGPVYVWANASGVAFDPNAWLPARNSGSSSDILVFNRGGVASASSVPTATVGQIVVSGGTEASFSGLGTATLTVAGGTGDDVSVERGSKAVLASSGSPVSVNVASGARAEINGDVEIRGGNNKFQALDPNGIVFQSTGRAIIGAGSSSTPFGDGTGASGLNSVLFHFGSMYIAQTTVAVFGASAPNAVVTFWPGSRFRMDAAFTPAASGRTYADFEYNVPAGNTTITGSNPFQVDSLIVTQGTFNVAMTGPVTIRGNIAISACTGANQLRFVPASPATYRLGGSGRQVFRTLGGCFNIWRVYASPNVTWNFDNPAGVSFLQAWRTSSNIQFTHGNLGSPDGWQFISDSTSTITGASQATGWVESPMTRRVAASGLTHFDIGDSANYLPMDVDVHGVTTPGYVLAGMYAWDPYDVGRAQLDQAHRVHRTWILTASSDPGNLFVPTFFSDLDATFPFLPSDVDPGSDPSQFEMRMFRGTDFPWRATTPGVRTATSTQALGLTPAVVDTFNALACGQPITPSLSVFDASAPEGNGPAAQAPQDGADLQVIPGRPTDLAGSDDVEVVSPLRTRNEADRASIPFARTARVQAAGSLSFRVRLSQAAVVPISVDYQTVDGTATVADGDYTPASGTLNFAAGDTALDVVVPFGPDATPERNETFGITLSNPSNATIGASTATGTILDDDDLIAPTAQVIYPNGGEVIYQNQQVNLQWTATDNVAVSGVDIQIVNGGSVTTLASNYPNTGSYLWSASGPASIKMRFRVVAHDDPGHATTDNSDANWELSPDVIGVGDDVPLAFALPAPSPNPSPGGLNRITFAVPHEAHVRLTIHDVRGRMVAKLADGIVPAGHHVRIWDSTQSASGVYFLRFEAPGFHADRRLVVIR